MKRAYIVTAVVNADSTALAVKRLQATPGLNVSVLEIELAPDHVKERTLEPVFIGSEASQLPKGLSSLPEAVFIDQSSGQHYAWHDGCWHQAPIEGHLAAGCNLASRCNLRPSH